MAIRSLINAFQIRKGNEFVVFEKHHGHEKVHIAFFIQQGGVFPGNIHRCAGIPVNHPETIALGEETITEMQFVIIGYPAVAGKGSDIQPDKKIWSFHTLYIPCLVPNPGQRTLIHDFVKDRYIPHPASGCVAAVAREYVDCGLFSDNYAYRYAPNRNKKSYFPNVPLYFHINYF